MTKKVHYEYLPVFERNIFYANDLDALEAEVYRYYRKGEIDYLEVIAMDGDGALGFAATIAPREDPLRVLAFIMFVKDTSDSGTVAHEATHICNKIFDYIGQEGDEVNDEVQAYLVGHVTKTFNEQIRGHKKTSRKLRKGQYKKNIA